MATRKAWRTPGRTDRSIRSATTGTAPAIVTMRASSDRGSSTRICIARDSATDTGAGSAKADTDKLAVSAFTKVTADPPKPWRRRARFAWGLAKSQKPTHPIHESGGCVGHGLSPTRGAHLVELDAPRRCSHSHLFYRPWMRSSE